LDIVHRFFGFEELVGGGNACQLRNILKLEEKMKGRSGFHIDI